MSWSLISRAVTHAVGGVHRVLSCSNLQMTDGYSDVATFVDDTASIFVSYTFAGDCVDFSVSDTGGTGGAGGTPSVEDTGVSVSIESLVDDFQGCDTCCWRCPQGTLLLQLC